MENVIIKKEWEEKKLGVIIDIYIKTKKNARIDKKNLQTHGL